MNHHAIATTCIQKLRNFRLTFKKIAERSGFDAGHLHRVTKGLRQAREDMARALLGACGKVAGEVAEARLAGTCLSPRADVNIGPGEKQAIEREVVLALGMSPEPAATPQPVPLPDGIEGALVRVKNCPNLVIIVYSEHCNPQQVRKVFLHELDHAFDKSSDPPPEPPRGPKSDLAF